MWRFLRNHRLILRLHYYLGTHILGASRGGFCDSTALVYHDYGVNQGRMKCYQCQFDSCQLNDTYDKNVSVILSLICIQIVDLQ